VREKEKREKKEKYEREKERKKTGKEKYWCKVYIRYTDIGKKIESIWRVKYILFTAIARIDLHREIGDRYRYLLIFVLHDVNFLLNFVTVSPPHKKIQT